MTEPVTTLTSTEVQATKEQTWVLAARPNKSNGRPEGGVHGVLEGGSRSRNRGGEPVGLTVKLVGLKENRNSRRDQE